MQKKYCLLILAFAFMLGTIVASLPPVKASVRDDVKFFVWNPAYETNIYPGEPPYTMITVEIWIDSPDAWDNTASGITGYALSVRVDPNVLMIGYAEKIPDKNGFLEDFIFHKHPLYSFPPYKGYTALLQGEADTAAGTLFDISEQILSEQPLPGYPGGGPYPLCQVVFMTLSETEPSPIGIMGLPKGVPPEKYWIDAWYKTADGVEHPVEVIEHGYYNAETPDRIEFDSSPGWDPLMNPMHTDWHELWPNWCDWWTLESWEDNGVPPGEPDGVLDPSDQIDMLHAPEGTKWWFHVEWVNPNPIPNDGKADLICTVKPVPEFPLGVGLMIALAPAIPIVYLWRTRKKGVEQ